MADTFTTCLAFTLQAEGGWADDPNDPGGCTMQGITLSSFRAWKKNPSLTCADLRVITADEVHDFYYQQHWLPVQGANLPLGVDLMIMDAGVNMGISRSVKILQQQLHLNQIDGVLGDGTLAATLAVEAIGLVQSLALAQAAFYRTLADYSIYGVGWLNRVNARHAAATSMMSTS